MKAKQIEIGKKVWYYPILGGSERKKAVITGGPYVMCGTTCCNIDILGAVVCIDNLEDRKE